MTHGFDDQGCQFDKTGQQRNWWTAADKTAYEKRTKVLEDYFSGIEVINGKKINGKQTLGENIGDNGGLHVALRAMHDDKGVAGDIDEWYTAFNIKKSDPLFIPKNKRARVW